MKFLEVPLNQSHTSDSQLIEYRDKQEITLASAYKLYAANLYAYGMSMYSDATLVEDAIHDVFIDLNKRLDDIDRILNLKYYLLAALRHRLSYLLRDNRRYVASNNAEDETVSERTIEDILIEHEEDDRRIRLVKHLMSQLNPHQREMIYLRFVEGFSYEQIAKLMKINRQSVYNVFQRIFNKLRKETITYKWE